MSTETLELVPVRFGTLYLRMGDGPGAEWAKAVLEHAKTEGSIFNYNVLSCEIGVWGLEHILFTFDANIPNMGYDEAKTLGEEMAAKIVGETDVTVLFVSSLAGR